MAELFRILVRGGYVIWSAPLFSEMHGSPQDYWRFTPHGALALAEDAGFRVLHIWAPGGLRELAGYMLGITAPFWQRDDILNDHGSSWPLQVYMLAQKP